MNFTCMDYMFANSVYAKDLRAWQDDLKSIVSYEGFNKGTPTLTNDMLPPQLRLKTEIFGIDINRNKLYKMGNILRFI